MRRKSLYPARRIVTPSQLGAARMAALQDACDFDLDAGALDWAMWAVLKHDTHLRGWGLDGRQADLGITYTLEEDTRLGSSHQLVCQAYGHSANPHPSHHLHRPLPGRSVDEFLQGEREWLESVADWHGQVERVVAAGGDPRRPLSPHVTADPCLTRLVIHHGLGPDAFLSRIPRFGRFIVGRDWYRSNPMPRVIEIGGVKAHVERTAARLRVRRIGLGQGVSYSPPEPERARRVGILYTPRVQLSETVHDALIGQPLARLVEHPALDAGLRIRAISRSGSGVAVRVEGCEPIRPMADVTTLEGEG